MRVAIIGSKSLSVFMLQHLLERGHEILAVYHRDDEAGMKVWHEQLGHPSLEQAAIENNIQVYSQMKVNSSESLALLESLNLDIIFSCFWSEIFREPVLNIPKLGVFNMHTALLPKNRGSRPIPWSLINEESHCGITLHKMMTGVDNGPIVHQKEVEINAEDSASTLYDKVIEAGKIVFSEALLQFENNTYSLQHQKLSIATYQPRGEPFGGQLNPYWSKSKKERFKAAFTYPPFRGWRQYPNSGQKKVFVLLSVLNKTATTLPEKLDEFNESSRFSIGSPLYRKQIKALLENTNNDQTLIQESKIDQSFNFPLLDILNQQGRQGVSFTSTAELGDHNVRSHQPFRYKNGLLEIPHTRIESIDQFKEIITQLSKLTHTYGQDMFLHLVFDRDDQLCAQVSQEIKTFAAEEISFKQVCQLFDTDYETIST